MSTKTTFKRVALVAVASLGFGHGQTKSKAGIRTVPLVSEFVPLPKSPKTLNRALKEHSVTTHSLRHTYAYLLKQQGVHVTTA